MVPYSVLARVRAKDAARVPERARAKVAARVHESDPYSVLARVRAKDAARVLEWARAKVAARAHATVLAMAFDLAPETKNKTDFAHSSRAALPSRASESVLAKDAVTVVAWARPTARSTA